MDRVGRNDKEVARPRVEHLCTSRPEFEPEPSRHDVTISLVVAVMVPTRNRPGRRTGLEGDGIGPDHNLPAVDADCLGAVLCLQFVVPVYVELSHAPSLPRRATARRRFGRRPIGDNFGMLTILLIVLVVLLLFGGIGGRRFYGGRRRTVVREYDTDI